VNKNFKIFLRGNREQGIGNRELGIGKGFAGFRNVKHLFQPVDQSCWGWDGVNSERF